MTEWVIGLSGGIGSGKSTVAALLAEAGAEILDADHLAHQELTKPEIIDRLQSRFGAVILKPDGQIDRRSLAKIVFSDAEARIYLEECIHPGVRSQIENGVKTSEARLVVLDVPLLETSPLIDLCTHKIFIEAPQETRWNRVQDRGWTKEDWQGREAAQVPLEDKRSGADLIVDNSGNAGDTKRQLKTWLASMETS